MSIVTIATFSIFLVGGVAAGEHPKGAHPKGERTQGVSLPKWEGKDICLTPIVDRSNI
ncbi:MAG: hypothetical protein SV686_15110 [Thermodesulfobacteriota bacterium]|nr:hypothetical protein [Thermodesulfobacteriota bacterium]